MESLSAEVGLDQERTQGERDLGTDAAGRAVDERGLTVLAVAESCCSFALLRKVGTKSGGKEEVEYPVGQDARQAGE